MGEESDWYTVVPIPLDVEGREGGKRREEGRGTEREREREKKMEVRRNAGLNVGMG